MTLYKTAWSLKLRVGVRGKHGRRAVPLVSVFLEHGAVYFLR
jgi:hypothetical protein